MKGSASDERIIDYLYDEMSVEEKAAFEAELRSNSDLAQLVHQYELIKHNLEREDSDILGPPSPVLRAIINAARVEAWRRKSRSRKWSVRFASPQFAAAVAVIVVVAFGLFVAEELRRTKQKTKVETAIENARASRAKMQKPTRKESETDKGFVHQVAAKAFPHTEQKQYIRSDVKGSIDREILLELTPTVQPAKPEMLAVLAKRPRPTESGPRRVHGEKHRHRGSEFSQTSKADLTTVKKKPERGPDSVALPSEEESRKLVVSDKVMPQKESGSPVSAPQDDLSLAAQGKDRSEKTITPGLVEAERSKTGYKTKKKKGKSKQSRTKLGTRAFASRTVSGRLSETDEEVVGDKQAATSSRQQKLFVEEKALSKPVLSYSSPPVAAASPPAEKECGDREVLPEKVGSAKPEPSRGNLQRCKSLLQEVKNLYKQKQHGLALDKLEQMTRNSCAIDASTMLLKARLFLALHKIEAAQELLEQLAVSKDPAIAKEAKTLLELSKPEH